MGLNAVPTKREWLIPLATILISILLSSFTSYTATDKKVEARISVIESQRSEDLRWKERMEDKVDQILMRLPKLN